MYRHSLLLVLLLSLLSPSNSTASPSDFVIVGAGTTGCVVAANLCTRLPSAKITLLERALPRDADAEFLVRAPLNALRATQSSAVSEIFPSLPNPGLNGRTVTLTTGNTYGGTSATNALEFSVPLSDSVDRWGIRGLNFSRARRFYSIVRKKVRFDPQQPPFQQIYARDYIAAARAVGIQEVVNPFDGRLRDAIAESYIATDTRERRIDSCTAYLQPVLSGACASNLRVILGATVTKVVLDRDRKHTTGVEYVRTAKKDHVNVLNVSAVGEVILTAGAYGSPKLLQLSGIGPSNVLRAAGIAPLVDLPVGERTQARAVNFVSSQHVGIPPEPAAVERNLNETARRQFEREGGGVYGKANAAADLFLGLAGYGIMSTTVAFGTGRGDVEFASFCIGNPRSFGYLRVRDANPFSAPIVQTNLLGKDVDVNRMLTCVKRVARVHDVLSEKFEIVGTTPLGARFNGSSLRDTAGNTGTFVGGCRVGAVVSDTLRVNGVVGLRVIDASVIRRVPKSASIMASAYMIAEYASREIAKGHECAQAEKKICGGW